MPAYLSHAIFADNIFLELKKYNLLKVDVSKNKLRFDSIKPDFFSCYSKKYDCPDENHNFFVQDFVKTQIEYIIDNKLYEDSDVMSQFYGHVLHCIMDQYFHPFIYSKTDNIKTKGLSVRGKHFELESLIDSYLVKKHHNRNLDVKDYGTFCVDPKYIFMPKEEIKIINDCYRKVYGYSNICNSSMLLSIGVLLEERIIRCDVTSIKRKLYEILKFNYLSRSITFSECMKRMNLEHSSWINLNNSYSFQYSVDDLFKMSLSRSLEILEILNHNIYDKRKIDYEFFNAFEDISLDTGIKCNYQKVK